MAHVSWARAIAAEVSTTFDGVSGELRRLVGRRAQHFPPRDALPLRPILYPGGAALRSEKSSFARGFILAEDEASG